MGVRVGRGVGVKVLGRGWGRRQGPGPGRERYVLSQSQGVMRGGAGPCLLYGKSFTTAFTFVAPSHGTASMRL